MAKAKVDGIEANEGAQEPMDQRVTVMMSKSDLAVLDDYRFEKRYASRGEAMRRLVLDGISREK